MFFLVLAMCLFVAALGDPSVRAGTNTTAEVRVVGIQQGLWESPSNQVFLRFNFSKDESQDVPMLYNYTICYWIRAERSSYLLVHLSYAVSDIDSNSIFLYEGHDCLLAYINSVSQRQIQRKKFEFLPGVWHHFCHAVDEEEYTIFWQGEELLRSPAEGTPGTPLNGSLVIGQDQDKLGGEFDKNQVLLGEIGQLSIWDRVLPESEISNLAKCRSLGRGNIFSLDTADLEVFGNISDTRVSREYFCRSEPNYFVLPEEQTFDSILNLCHRLNGTMPMPSSQRDNDKLLEQVRPFMDVCGRDTNWKFWLGITNREEKGSWVSSSNGTPATFLNFVGPYPLNNTLYNCITLIDDGTWADTRCALRKCGICHLPAMNRLYLRGFCFDSDFHTRHRVSEYFDGRLVFRGHYGTFIFWNRDVESWCFHDVDKNMTVACTLDVGLDSYPLDTNQWKTLTETCGMQEGTLFEMNLSKCSDDLFPCRSGDCIEHGQRCNLHNDCPDGSDEENCEVVVPSNGYQSHLPPRGLWSSTLTLTPIVTLSRVAKIDDISMSVTLEFFVEITWRDKRLNFRHLSHKKNTLIPAKSVEKIWIPSFQFLDLEGGRLEVLDEKVMVTTSNGGILPGFNSLSRDITYPGSDNNLTLTRQICATFTCTFNLHIYPFDKQECHIGFHLPQEYQGGVAFSEAGSRGTYTGPKELALYTVNGVSLSPVQDWRNQVRLRFELQRRQGVILLSTFVPSGLLLIVSYATLFLEDLGTGAGLSLTILLVLYTLFANLLRAIPNTASIKMIDIWFFFLISLLVLNILVQIFVDYNGQFLSKVFTKKVAEKESPSKEVFGTKRMMALYRTAFPLIFIAFNIIFWWLVVFVYN